MKSTLINLFLIVILLFTSSFSNVNIETSLNILEESRSMEFPFDNLHTPWVDSVFNSLDFDQRIGQLFFVAAYSNLGPKHADMIRETITKYKIGGLIFFQGGPKRQVLLMNQYQALSQTPMLISIDAEWGLGMRLDSCVSFPRQMALGAISDSKLIFQMGNEIGLQCKRMGIHLNFAPVADVNNNSDNPVIGVRSFGENSHDVAQRSLMYMAGMQRQHILTAAKHFPGHGNTSVDSHFALPVVSDSYQSLDSLEWYPYKELIRHNLTGVLAAHVQVPAIDSTPNLAASLSPVILTHVLRDSLKFNGLIYTDALNMKGVSKFHKPGEVEVKALEAGVDVLLMPNNVGDAVSAIKAAVDSGRLSKEQIEHSCRKILAAKEWAGLDHYFPTDTSGLISYLNGPETDLLNRKLVENTLTLIQNQDSILPLKQLDREKTAILITGTSSSNSFLRTLRLYEENDYYFFDKNTTAVQEKKLFETLSSYSRVIIGINNTNSRPAQAFGVLPKTIAFVDRLADTTKVILSLFAPPYAMIPFKNKAKMSAIIISYQESMLAQNYTAQLIYGAIPARGLLPVAIDSAYHFHKRIKTAGHLRLKYSIPEEAGILSYKLQAIDSMVQHALDEKAFPGCQILAARNGIVFFNKEYGNTCYGEKGEAVQPEHIYDLASVTKIGAMTPSIMFLYDTDRISLKDKLSEYLPELDNSDKDKIILLDLMTHQARLSPFIGFYLNTMEPEDSTQKMFTRNPDPIHNIRLGAGMYLNSQTRFKDQLYTISKDDLHQLWVADEMFMLSSYRDTILTGIKDSKLLKTKQYRYSDLGFIMLTWLVERVSGEHLEDLASRTFYKRLGASSLGYQPLSRFPKERIVPTEHDTVFRKQWLQGHVHDQNASLMGGISGHAGLFGNANDLSKLMQMYLNKGTYGGETYLKEETLEHFTSSPFAKQGNRRGIGFDKPEPEPGKASPICKSASKSSFGHSGFTGTFTWADPETGLLYVFLSNRVCPDATNNKLISLNLRTRIFDVLAKSIND